MSDGSPYQQLAHLADSLQWPCRRHRLHGCDDCTSCRMVRALHAVGLGVGLEPGVPQEEDA